MQQLGFLKTVRIKEQQEWADSKKEEEAIIGSKNYRKEMRKFKAKKCEMLLQMIRLLIL